MIRPCHNECRVSKEFTKTRFQTDPLPDFGIRSPWLFLVLFISIDEEATSGRYCDSNAPFRCFPYYCIGLAVGATYSTGWATINESGEKQRTQQRYEENRPSNAVKRNQHR